MTNDLNGGLLIKYIHFEGHAMIGQRSRPKRKYIRCLYDFQRPNNTIMQTKMHSYLIHDTLR